MNKLQKFEKEQISRKKLPEFRSGDTVRVYIKIREGEKERLQPYEGVVIRNRKGGVRATFTVRKISYGIGVERIFPLHSPLIDRIEIIKRGQVRRARLYYLRKLRGKAARVKDKRYVAPDKDKIEANLPPEEEVVQAETEEVKAEAQPEVAEKPSAENEKAATPENDQPVEEAKEEEKE